MVLKLCHWSFIRQGRPPEAEWCIRERALAFIGCSTSLFMFSLQLYAIMSQRMRTLILVDGKGKPFILISFCHICWNSLYILTAINNSNALIKIMKKSGIRGFPHSGINPSIRHDPWLYRLNKLHLSRNIINWHLAIRCCQRTFVTVQGTVASAALFGEVRRGNSVGCNLQPHH